MLCLEAMSAMFSKIAINNVKRSFKNYSIYFLTLTLAICVFYSFNSLEAQNAVLEMNQDVAFLLNLNYFTVAMSVFVSFVLGWLIIYANNFLIKKRKKELGIYITLGMSKGKISRILILETLVIGVFSLLVGIVLGIIVSQGMAVITAHILSADVEKYKFIVSMGAIGKTVIYFGIIYTLVMLFNQFTISKYKLIDLLYAAKKNEEVKVKNSVLSVLIFLLSAAMLIFAYNLFLTKSLAVSRGEMVAIAVLGVGGTLLFFFSLSNFFVQMVQKNKRIYLKDINLFVLRQINNKVNTNFLSMTFISLLLFFTVTFLFIAFDVKGIIDKNAAETSPFDASGYLYNEGTGAERQVSDIESYFKTIGFEFEPSEKTVFYNEYRLSVEPADLLAPYLSEQQQIDLEEGFVFGTVLKISDYNSIRELTGQKTIALEEDEVFIVSDSKQAEKAVAEYQTTPAPLVLEGKEYAIKNESPVKEDIRISGSGEFLYVIVPDKAAETMEFDTTGFNVIYGEETSKKSEEKFSALFTNFREGNYKSLSPVLAGGETWQQYQEWKNAPAAIVVFLGMFLGLIFIITCAAVLALQQLSDASDSLERYKSLKKIGVTKKMIDGAIWKQTFICFMLPMSLAIVHSIVGIVGLRELLSIDLQSILTGSLLVAVIYGGYFYATYLGVKNIVENSN